jgi:hypothetical protein
MHTTFVCMPRTRVNKTYVSTCNVSLSYVGFVMCTIVIVYVCIVVYCVDLSMIM